MELKRISGCVIRIYIVFICINIIIYLCSEDMSINLALKEHFNIFSKAACHCSTMTNKTKILPKPMEIDGSSITG